MIYSVPEHGHGQRKCCCISEVLKLLKLWTGHHLYIFVRRPLIVSTESMYVYMFAHKKIMVLYEMLILKLRKIN